MRVVAENRNKQFRFAGGASFRLVLIVAAVSGIVAGIFVGLNGISDGRGMRMRHSFHVVVYTSQDQVYSKEILDAFTKETGIEVRAVYDSEAVKTVGLANRLLAEREHPQCDLWWSNEELRTRQLEAAGVFSSEDRWRAFGFRSRKLVVNTNLLSVADVPTSLSELSDAKWRGKVAMAYPMFGTTATHMLALRQLWGVEKWRAWSREVQANDTLIVDGNSVVVRLVGKGEVAMGLTDSDDIAAGQREGMPIAAIEIDETLFIPNTVAIVRGSRNISGARRLLEYLSSTATVGRLVAVNALEGANADSQDASFPDWGGVLGDLNEGTAELSRVFLR